MKRDPSPNGQHRACPRALAALLLAAGLVAACGGGGGSDPAPAPAAPTAPPTSGTYAWVLKAEGASDNVKYGLSLVHPSTPAVEWVIEPPNGAVSDVKVLYAGTPNAGASSVSALAPVALVYVVGGDVRRVSLQADGSDPKAGVRTSQTTSACAFLLDANDYASPLDSRFVVSTAGADGRCGSGAADATPAEVTELQDNGSAEVRLSAAAPGISVTPIGGAQPLAALRNPATLAPSGWLYPTQAVFWGSTAAVPLRATAAAITRVVRASHRSVLVESLSGPALLDFSGGTAFTDTPVAAPAADGWNGLGHDETYFYAYRNSGNESGSWDVLRVNRSNGAAGVLGSGNGAISTAALGREAIYVTALGTTRNRLLRLNKRVPGTTPVVVEDTVRSTISQVLASAGDVHQLWRVTNVGGSNPGNELQIIDETGAVLFSSTGGGFPMDFGGGTTLDFNAGESRTVFLFADGYGSRAFGDATLTAYDAAARRATVVGRLPGSPEYGGDFVFARVTSMASGRAGGSAARSVAGVLQGAGARVFSFDPAAASSIQYTTRQQ